MAFISHTDLESQKNITLTEDGQTLVATLIAAAWAWSEKYCRRTWTEGSFTEYFSPDDNLNLFYVANTPLNTAETVTVAEYNPSSASYDTYTGTVRKNAGGAVKIDRCLAYGWEAVKITYTGGYTSSTFPDDLKQALIELVARKFTDAQSDGKEVKRVKAVDYEEEYAFNTADIPADILEVVNSYVRPVVV